MTVFGNPAAIPEIDTAALHLQYYDAKGSMEEHEISLSIGKPVASRAEPRHGMYDVPVVRKRL